MIDRNQWVLETDFLQVSLSKWQKTVTLMADLFQAPSGFIVQYAGNKGYQVTISSEQPENPYAAGGIIPPETNIFCKKVVADNQPLYVQDAPIDPCWDDNPEVTNDGFRSYFGFPVHWPDGEPFGTICVMDFKKTSYQEPYIGLLSQFCGLIENDLALMEEYKKVEALSLTDDMTGLYNRRGFLMMAEKEISVARRYHHHFALLYLDIDNLKQVNDSFGHEEGDRAIRLVADLVQTQLREADLAARIGGDEFVALVFLKTEQEAKFLAQRIKDKITKHCESDPVLSPSGVSIGCVFYDQHSDQSIEAMMSAADKLMYKEKNSES